MGMLKHAYNYKNITGERFGRLVVLEELEERKIVGKNKKKKIQYRCKCDCGNECIVVGEALKSGIKKSCGCLYKETRGLHLKNYCKYDLESFDFGIAYCENDTYFFFDKEDYDKIKEYSWWYDGKYVVAHSLRDDEYTTKIVRLHRVVMNVKDREDIEVDHINTIRYDCRKSNLRLATTSENARNKDWSQYSNTGVTGIRKVDNLNKWIANIKINKKNIYLGTYYNLEDAINARRKAEEIYFLDFRYNPDSEKINENILFKNS